MYVLTIRQNNTYFTLFFFCDMMTLGGESMRDIPMFTTENGIASLILSEIPYNRKAYIRIHDSCMPDALLQECYDFCKMAGAETIYAGGDPVVVQYPHHTDVLEMCRSCEELPETDAKLVSLQKEMLENWRDLYNSNMRNVLGASFMTITKAEEILSKGIGYLIYRDDKLIGIGIAQEDRIDCVVSLIPGSGRDVLVALCGVLTGERIVLEVASTNKRAVSLYEKLGFVQTEVKFSWYQIHLSQ